MSLFLNNDFIRRVATLAFAAYNEYPSRNLKEFFISERQFPTANVPHLTPWKQEAYSWISDVKLEPIATPIEQNNLSCRFYYEGACLYVVFRGTYKIENWLVNLNFHQSELDDTIFGHKILTKDKKILVHNGFQNAFLSIQPFLKQTLDEIFADLDRRRIAIDDIVVTGKSNLAN